MHDAVQIGLIFGASIFLSAFVTCPPETIAKIIGIALGLFIVVLFITPFIMVYRKYNPGKQATDKNGDTSESSTSTETSEIRIEEIIEEADVENDDCIEETGPTRTPLNELESDATEEQIETMEETTARV